MAYTFGTRGNNIIRGRTSGVHFKGYITGGPEMARKLAQLEKGMRDELLKEATLAGANVIAEEWRSRARSTIGYGPGTAHYVEAIAAMSRAGRRGATAYVGLATVAAEPGEAQPRDYAAVLEFGTRNKPARPTLRPAFDSARPRALDALAAKLRELMGRAL
jgi:HK97 gp10 family phage protein